MRSNRILSTVFVIVACCTFTTTALTRADLPVVGTGINGINYHMTQWIFADVAGIWWKFDDVTGQQCWQDKNSQNAVQYEFDEDNYPLSLPAGDYIQCYPFRHNGGLYPTGEYVLTWEGDGDIELRTNVTLVSSTANRKVYNCTAPSNLGITLRLLRTNPADRVRNIRLWMPGTENAGSLFHPEFKRRLAPFGVLRFMDPLSTNGNPQVAWSERRKPSNFFKSGANGMPYAFAVDLCNELQKDLWLNVPAKANDAFIDSLAALIKSRLNPGLRCWIEYSNETWNSNFTVQYQYTLALKDLWGLSNRPAAHGRRSVQIFDIFERVFGGTDRLIRIMAGQARNSWQLREAMKEAASYCAPGPVRVDVASVAYYFTDKSTVNLIWNQRNNSNKDTIWADLYKQIDGDVGPVENMALATQYGIPMVGYEGGDHLNAVSQDDSLSAAQCDELAGYIADIVRNPRFVDVYKYALNRWYTIGATTPVAFVYCAEWSRYGQWGHLEHQTQPTDSAPKYKALLEWADSMAIVPVLPYAPSARAIGIANTQRHGYKGAIFDASGRMRMRFTDPSNKLLPRAPGLYISVPNGFSTRAALTIR